MLPKGLGDSNLLWVLLLALVVSAPLSFVLLRKQRDAMAEQIVGTVDRAKARLEANRTQEDGVEASEAPRLRPSPVSARHIHPVPRCRSARSRTRGFRAFRPCAGSVAGSRAQRSTFDVLKVQVLTCST